MNNDEEDLKSYCWWCEEDETPDKAIFLKTYNMKYDFHDKPFIGFYHSRCVQEKIAQYRESNPEEQISEIIIIPTAEYSDD